MPDKILMIVFVKNNVSHAVSGALPIIRRQRMKCPQFTSTLIMSSDVRLSAQLSCLLAAAVRYLPILEAPLGCLVLKDMVREIDGNLRR